MFRKSASEHWPKALYLLLSGMAVKASKTVGWLVDYTGSMEDSLQTVWKIATESEHGIQRRPVADGAVTGVPTAVSGLSAPDGDLAGAARKAIIDTVQHSCGANLSDALAVQTKHSAEFMTSKACQQGQIGSEYTKTMGV